MRRNTGLAIAVATAAMVFASALPAVAETNGIFDPQGDAPSFLDVTSVEVHDQKKDLVIKTIVPGFDPAHLTYPSKPLAGGDDWTGLFLSVQVKGVDGKVWTPTWKNTLGQFRVEVGPQGSINPVDLVLLSRQRGSTTTEFTCSGARTVLKEHVITTTIPQSCFKRVKGAGAGAVKVKAVMRGNVGPQSTSDSTATTPWVHKAKK